MKSLAQVLTSLDRTSSREQSGKRYVLQGANEYFRSVFRYLLISISTELREFEVDATNVRSSALALRDMLQTASMPWEHPLIWVKNADLLLGAMVFPEDLPVSSHTVVLLSDTDLAYVPASCTSVLFSIKGAGQPLQDVIRWMIQSRGLGADTDVVRHLAGEYKNAEGLEALAKLLDRSLLSIHPRTVLVVKDVEEADLHWDTMALLQGIRENSEQKALSEMQFALETFSPKGIVTVLTRRIALLMQIAQANVVSGGTDFNLEVKPWMWKQYSEFLGEVPLKRLAQWAITLDKGAATLQAKTRLPHRWLLMNTILEMCRS